MKRVFIAIVAGLGASVYVLAEPFQQAEITRKVNTVSLVEKQASKPAEVGDVVKGSTAVKTGSDSRAELQFPDMTLTRLGANTLFSFETGGRAMSLESGTMLFSSPKGKGGGQVQAGAVTAAVTGTEFLLSRLANGDIQLVVLEGKVKLFFTDDPEKSRVYRAGESVTIPKGSTVIPNGVTINLRRLIATSRLLEGGNLGPLPRQAVLIRVADSQQGRIKKIPAVIVRDQQAAQTARRTEEASRPVKRPQPPARPQPTPVRPVPHKPIVPPPHPNPSYPPGPH